MLSAVYAPGPICSTISYLSFFACFSISLCLSKSLARPILLGLSLTVDAGDYYSNSFSLVGDGGGKLGFLGLYWPGAGLSLPVEFLKGDLVGSRFRN